MGKSKVRLLSLLMATVLTAGLPATAAPAERERNETPAPPAETAAAATPGASVPAYMDYLAAQQDDAAGRDTLTLVPEEAAEKVDGKDAVTLSDDGRTANFAFTVAHAGWYCPMAEYYPTATGSSLDLSLSFTLDGKIPFAEAAAVWLPRTYVNEEIRRDSTGNDLRPAQVEAPEWMTAPFWENTGYHPDGFRLYLTAGQHRLTVKLTQGTLALAAIRLTPPQVLPAYAQVASRYAEEGYRDAGILYEIEAETAGKKSGAALYPDTDRANAATTPAHPSFTRINVITSSKPGDWLEWTLDVPKTGLYQIGMRVLQDGNRGMISTRRLYIDGAIPFAEAQYIEFPYASSWYNHTLGGEQSPWLFYFTEGRHTLRLETTTGRFSEALRTLQDAVKNLNVLCRRITMVTGLSPDVYRDYQYDTEIPDLREQLTANRDLLAAELERLGAEMETEGSALSTVEELLRQLESFLKNERKIAAGLGNFRTNISSLGTWIFSMTEQKLTMDTLVLYSGDHAMRPAGAGFFGQLGYDIRALIGSFMIDYNAIGAADGESARTVTAWASAGRDQANILRRLIDDDFTSKSDIGVHLSLVGDSAALLQATLAGKGPDVALFVEKTLPVNLAARGALEDLSGYDGFEEVCRRFSPSAMIPYTFDGGVWALPCTQGFNVMFIRTDIFDELGIAVPQTWEELYKAQTVIQRENMQVGLGAGAVSLFETLILQYGGRFYTDDLSAVAFDTPEVLEAFKTWTSFYSEYDAAITYDAFSYFRSGVMPLLIADYTLYNQIAVAAPEIRGLWRIVPIPGVRREDGSVNRAESATGTAAIMMKNTKDKEAAFRFLDWWMRESVQTRYSLDLEATMGPAARYNSATRETIGRLAWSREEYAAILAQWDEVWDIESIPSSYYVTRNLNNAFRRVVYKRENKREVLNHYAAIINKEITRKNRELGVGKEAEG